MNSADHRVLIPKKGDVVHLTRRNYFGWRSLILTEGHKISESAEYGILIDDHTAVRYTVENNYLFVLGDNHDHSFDSRAWGILPEKNVIGEAMMIYWSVDASTGIRWERVGKVVR